MLPMEHPHRDIVTARSRDVPRDFLQSLFACELMEPSRPLWIVSPWISDVVLLDNSARQFAALNSSWSPGPIRLIAVLTTLLDRGGSVRILVNDTEDNDEFAHTVRELLDRYPGACSFRRVTNLHTKGIVGERFTLDGSMNLTHSGVYRNEEHLIYRTDPADVHERRLTLSDEWGGAA